MKKILVVYDDSKKPNKEVRTITGEKSYGDTIFKRVTLRERIIMEIQKNRHVIEILNYNGDADIIKKYLANVEDEISILHLYSNYGLASTKEFEVLLEKTEYINQNYSVVCENKITMHLINGRTEYTNLFDSIINRSFEADKIESNAFMDLSKLSNFLNFITSGFDARYFNALLGDEYTVTKKSKKKDKIKSEFNFYYLLPDDMKMWFVMPFNYEEASDYAAYTMERFHMTDIAIRFVHGAVSIDEFKDILDKLFYFIKSRTKKSVGSAKGREVAEGLYIKKLNERISELEKLPQYEKFNQLLIMGTKYGSIKEIVDEYKALYNKIKRNDKEYEYLVVGHGDLCFSNILYNKEASILKLIDPKGALCEEDLYTDPYYDLAKLSHSVCGCYDFFNSGLYEVSMDRDMNIELRIDANPEPFKEIFKEYLERDGYKYGLVRLYEASLFLSMLPYHIDQPGKVFGFVLNAINILKEVKECTVK